MQKIQSLYYLLFVALWSHQTNGFSPVSKAPTTHRPTKTAYFSGPFLGARLEAFVLDASAGKKKMTRRRVRKQAPGATAEDPVKQAQEVIEGVQKYDDIISLEDDEGFTAGEMTEKDRMLIEEVAKFEFSPPKANVAASSSSSSNIGVSEEKKKIPMSDLTEALKKLEEITAAKEADVMSIELSDDNEMLAPPSGSDGVIPLPDIRQALKKKAAEEEIKRMEAEKKAARVRIKRTDKEAFRRLLEQQPFADADASYFVEEEYGAVSALLGEGAETFLGIPSGPIQVSHFIGALVIVLMAFVEYPGFPLTNLPTPLRESLQAGLATTYAINTVLAVLAAFKAPERGQPRLLWVPKTFLIGGLAYDQLTQLPTLQQIEATKARKGARAPKR